MSFHLSDDGTLDTVIVCDECGEELRYNYDGEMTDEDTDADPETSSDAFVDWALEDAAEQHECPCAEPDEPQEDDITTEDHQRFYCSGKLIAEVDADSDWQPIIGAWCKRNGYFPNVWFISDHGNAHLISVGKDGRYLDGHAD